MFVEPEENNFGQMAGFERELRGALARRPAPLDLKRKVMQQHRASAGSHRERVIWFERLAASLVLAGAVGGAVVWRHAEEQRRGEEVKQQLYTALRITNHTLEEMNAQLQQRREKEESDK
jgi:hypothetical protein